MRYEVQHGTYIKEDNITVEDWFKIWNEEYKEPSVKKGTVHTYKATYENYIKTIMGKQRLKDIRPEHIQKLYNDLYRKEYSRNTLELVSVVLSGMFKQAVKNKIVHENPVVFATLPKIYQESERRVMNIEEQHIFMKYAQESKLSDLLELALSTGMRSGELRALEWSDVDFKTKTIHVTGTLNYYGGVWFKDTPKTPTSKRDIPMLDNVYKILREHRAKQLEWRLLIGKEWVPLDKLDNLIFTNDVGKPLNRDRLKKELDKVVSDIQSAGYSFENIHPHTFATRCIENGMKLQVLKAILGHSKLSMTMDLYAHVLPDAKAEEIQKIAGLFNTFGSKLGQNQSEQSVFQSLDVG